MNCWRPVAFDLALEVLCWHVRDADHRLELTRRNASSGRDCLTRIGVGTGPIFWSTRMLCLDLFRQLAASLNCARLDPIRMPMQGFIAESAGFSPWMRNKR